MFESKLKIYYIQKSAERKVFWLFTEKVWKRGKINTNLKLSWAFVNNIFYIHMKSLCQYISIDIKNIDIAQHLTAQ